MSRREEGVREQTEEGVISPYDNYGKIKKDSNFHNDIVSLFFRAAL